MLCISCKKPLVAIGHARKNGVQHHGDWSSRLYHKNCLKNLEPCKVYFNVSFNSKDIAKSLGARFNPNRKQWYAPNNVVRENLDALFERTL